MTNRVLWYVMVFSGVVNFAWALFSSSLGMAVPYYRKLTLHEIKVLEINANLMENDFRLKKINAKDEVEFHNKGN